MKSYQYLLRISLMPILALMLGIVIGKSLPDWACLALCIVPLVGWFMVYDENKYNLTRKKNGGVKHGKY